MRPKNFLLGISQVRVVPTITVRNPDLAVLLARKLVTAGYPVLQVALGTDEALNCVERIHGELEEAFVGVGSVLNRFQFNASRKSGAKFVTSPAISKGLIDESREHDLPFVPGVATPSEIAFGLDSGMTLFNVFPADKLGGPGYIGALSALFAQVGFCPAGGIPQHNVSSYLALPNVLAVFSDCVIPEDVAQDNSIYRKGR